MHYLYRIDMVVNVSIVALCLEDNLSVILIIDDIAMIMNGIAAWLWG